MVTVNVNEAKTRLSELLRRVENGEDVIIARRGEPIAKIVTVQKGEPRVPGQWKGKIIIHEDFDAPIQW